MSIITSDIILIPITNQLKTTSNFIVEKLLLFGHSESCFSHPDSNSYIQKVQKETIVEYAFLDYVTQRLSDRFGYLSLIDRFKELQKIGFVHTKSIGDAEEGSQFFINNETIALVVSNSKNIKISQLYKGLKDSSNSSKPLKLIIKNALTPQADIYIHSFLLENDIIAILGFHRGLPPINKVKNAYIIYATKLKPIDDLLFQKVFFS